MFRCLMREQRITSFFVSTFIELLDRKIESHGTYIYNPNEQTLYMTQSQMLQKNLCDLPAKF